MGLRVGTFVGLRVVGLQVGAFVGLRVGAIVGLRVGTIVGRVGTIVGLRVGATVGVTLRDVSLVHLVLNINVLITDSRLCILMVQSYRRKNEKRKTAYVSN